MAREERAVTDRALGGTGARGCEPPTGQRGGAGASRVRRAGPWLLWATGFGACGAVLFWCYLRQSSAVGINSDAAGQVLQGWDMLHGNPLLRGWFLSDVSFYTFEVPLDGLVATVRGLRPDVAHITAAIIYMLLVLVAALLAKGRARGTEGLVRALLAAGVLVAPGLSPGTQVLLLAPDHTGIGVPVMLALLYVDRVPERWWLPAGACVLLIWAQLDDPVATYACAAPLAIVCAVRAAAALVARLGGRRQALPWWDAALAVAAVTSYAMTRLAVSAMRAAGGFYVHAVIGGTGFASLAAMPRHLLWTAQNLLYLFGANYFSQPTPLDAARAYLHLAGVAMALCGVAIGAWGLFFRLAPVFRPGPSGRADRVTQVLTVGIVVVLVAGALGTHAALIQGAHEIAIVLPLGAALGGRLVGSWLAGSRSALPRAGRAVRIALASVLAVAGAGYLAVLGYDASQPAQSAPTQSLADWLVAHDLTSGLAGYWDANVTTLASGGRVRVAPLANGGTYAYPWESRASWYDPAISFANFVVTVPYPPSAASYARPSVVRARYGRPARTYHFGQYTIMVYDYNLLQRVRQPVADRL